MSVRTYNLMSGHLLHCNAVLFQQVDNPAVACNCMAWERGVYQHGDSQLKGGMQRTTPSGTLELRHSLLRSWPGNESDSSMSP